MNLSGASESFAERDVLSKFFIEEAAKQLSDTSKYAFTARLHRKSVMDIRDDNVKNLTFVRSKLNGKFMHFTFQGDRDALFFGGDFNCNSRLQLSILIRGEDKDVLKVLKVAFNITITNSNKKFSYRRLEGTQLKTSIISLSQYLSIQKELGSDDSLHNHFRRLSMTDNDARIAFESGNTDWHLQQETVTPNLLCNIEEVKTVVWTLPVSKIYDAVLSCEGKTQEEISEIDNAAEVSQYLQRFNEFSTLSEEEITSMLERTRRRRRTDHEGV